MELVIKFLDEQKQKAIEKALTSLLLKYLKDYNTDAKAGVKFEKLKITDDAENTVIDICGKVTIDNNTVLKMILSLLPFH